MSNLLDKFRLDPADTAVVVIDVQERLAAAMRPQVLEDVVHHARVLVQGAQALEVPTLYTEQYPKGLGPTIGPLQELFPNQAAIEKVCFDACDAEGFGAKLGSPGTVILAGMEAHICVLQTALGLLREGRTVWVAQDTICSRRVANRQAAVRLLNEAGAIVAPTETILFLMVQTAGSPNFKAISALVR